MEERKGIQSSKNSETFFDLIEERRSTSDVVWALRPGNLDVPHKLPDYLKYSRKQVIEAVLVSPRIVLLIQLLASARNVPISVVENEARDMLAEMASDTHIPTIRCLAILVIKALKRIFKSILVNRSFVLELKAKMKTQDGVQFVYVPSHRSYLDFILMSYILMASDMNVPNIASGMDFYKMRVVGELLRKTGAFYMRRTFATDQLYKEVFRAYISCIVAHSEQAIEFFIEGTRSRSQKSLAPKYGLLGMILEGLWKGNVLDIQFVPLSMTYDRPLEELLFAYELLGVPKPPESTAGLFKSLSVLKDNCAYGNAYINVAPPISARQFIDSDTLRKRTLSPNSKLPFNMVKELAYAIIDSHKKHTVLSPFNLIALLFNEKVHSHPAQAYILETLIADYLWLKEFLVCTMNALVHLGSPSSIEPGRDLKDKDVKREVLDALYTHRQLLMFDSNGELTLMERHRESQACDPTKIKGYPLSEITMRVAVPAINIVIYTNPSMAYLSKPAFVAVSIIESGVDEESVFARYILLRKLLSTEFALVSEKSVATADWEEGLALLLAEDCVRFQENLLLMGSNTKLFSLLKNLLLPFLAASYVTSTVLHQWNDDIGEAMECYVLKNAQKQTELLLLKGQGMFKFPYSLSLDLYSSTLTSLVCMGIINASGRPPHTIYSADKEQLGALITELDRFKILGPVGSYLNIRLQPADQTLMIPQAKL